MGAVRFTSQDSPEFFSKRIRSFFLFKRFLRKNLRREEKRVENVPKSETRVSVLRCPMVTQEQGGTILSTVPEAQRTKG